MNVFLLTDHPGRMCAATPGEPLRSLITAHELGAQTAYAIGSPSHKAATTLTVAWLDVSPDTWISAQLAAWNTAFPGGLEQDPALRGQLTQVAWDQLNLAGEHPVGTVVHLTAAQGDQILLTPEDPTLQTEAKARRLAAVAGTLIQDLLAPPQGAKDVPRDA